MNFRGSGKEQLCLKKFWGLAFETKMASLTRSPLVGPHSILPDRIWRKKTCLRPRWIRTRTESCPMHQWRDMRYGQLKEVSSWLNTTRCMWSSKQLFYSGLFRDVKLYLYHSNGCALSFYTRGANFDCFYFLTAFQRGVLEQHEATWNRWPPFSVVCGILSVWCQILSLKLIKI